MLAPGVASRRLGFGCAGLLQEPSASKRQRLLAEAFEQGINHFDVARMYGLGAVEAEVGRFARARRESVAIATKFGIEPVAAAGRLAALQGPARRMLARYPALRDRVRRGADVFNAPRSYDGAAARTSLHKSLRELQTDYVDLLLVHDPAPGDPVDLPSICAYLEEAHQAGQVRAWGVAGERDPCVQLTRQMPAPAILQIRDDILLRSEPWPQELEPVIASVYWQELSNGSRVTSRVRPSAAYAGLRRSGRTVPPRRRSSPCCWPTRSMRIREASFYTAPPDPSVSLGLALRHWVPTQSTHKRWRCSGIACAASCRPPESTAMRVDSLRLAPGSSLETDVAVVGAGPAGIVAALELAKGGLRVLLIDSGGDRRQPEAQQLGDLVGEDPAHVSMALATSRQVGGASNLWGGRCVPFDPIDFAPREIVGGSHWPVSYDELQPFFQRACEWCVCGDAVFNAREVASLTDRSLVPGFPDGAVAATALERWSLPTNFGREYRTALADTERLTLITNLTCTEIVCLEGEAKVHHLKARGHDGRSITVVASRYVLACGGLEVTRLLFASNRTHPAGLGNHSGHLGRWYMAHVESRIARVRFATPPSQTIYGHERDKDGVYVRRRMTFSADYQAKEGLPNAAIWLVNPDVADPKHGNGILSFVYLMLASPFGRFFVAEGIRQAHIKTAQPVSVHDHLRNIVRELPTAVRFAFDFGYRRFLRRGRKVPGFFVPSAANTYPLLYHGEHLPHEDSCVEPSEQRDALGMPRLRTRLRFGEDDVAGVLRAHRCLDEYLRAHGLGHLEYVHEDSETAVREQLFGGYHQAGTTRMSTDAADGVVDRDLAVHGCDNLFVASSSTFVTSSQANSTFMVVAFVLRLVDHLISNMLES